MKHHGLIVLVLGAYLRLGNSTPQQTSSQRTSAVSNPPGPTARPRELANARRQDGSGDTCGFVGYIPVACSAGPCVLLSVLGGTEGYMGCCNDDGCSFQTDCVEGGTASDTKTLACIGESSFCATYTWPDYEAAAYYCATSRSTDTVTTMDPEFSSTYTAPGFTSTYGGQTGDDDATSGSRQNTGAPHPTFTASGTPTGAIPTEAGTPELPVYDLATRQRIGAGVGSGAFGLLLLGFFAVFGCWKGPRRTPRLALLPGSPNQAYQTPTDTSEMELVHRQAPMGYARLPLNGT